MSNYDPNYYKYYYNYYYPNYQTTSYANANPNLNLNRAIEPTPCCSPGLAQRPQASLCCHRPTCKHRSSCEKCQQSQQKSAVQLDSQYTVDSGGNLSRKSSTASIVSGTQKSYPINQVPTAKKNVDYVYEYERDYTPSLHAAKTKSTESLHSNDYKETRFHKDNRSEASSTYSSTNSLNKESSSGLQQKPKTRVIEYVYDYDPRVGKSSSDLHRSTLSLNDINLNDQPKKSSLRNTDSSNGARRKVEYIYEDDYRYQSIQISFIFLNFLVIFSIVIQLFC
jgi:hypothetical protein